MAINLYVSKADTRGQAQTSCLWFRWLQMGKKRCIPCVLHISKMEKVSNIILKTSAEIECNFKHEGVWKLTESIGYCCVEVFF